MLSNASRLIIEIVSGALLQPIWILSLYLESLLLHPLDQRSMMWARPSHR
jgi:hypothetical protein